MITSPTRRRLMKSLLVKKERRDKVSEINYNILNSFFYILPNLRFIQYEPNFRWRPVGASGYIYRLSVGFYIVKLIFGFFEHSLIYD